MCEKRFNNEWVKLFQADIISFYPMASIKTLEELTYLSYIGSY